MTTRLVGSAPAPVSSDPSRAQVPDVTEEREATAWDVMGVVGLVAVMLTVERAVVVAMDTPLGRSQAIRVLTLASWAVVLVGLGLLIGRDRPRLVDVPRRLTEVWRDPPGGWVAFALGSIVAVPVLAFYAPVLFWDSDSARLVANIRHVQSGGGFDFFTTTQEVFLPHLLLGPGLAVGGLAAAKLVTLLSVLALAGVVSYITHHITGRMIAAAASAAALLALSPLYERTLVLPMYPTALALGYLGGWLGYRAVTEGPDVAWRLVIPAGVLLALAPEAQWWGQVFLAVPALLVVFAGNVRAGVRTASALYLVIAACSVPRVVVNLWEGGLTHANSSRTDYWMTEGYISDIWHNFWRYPDISDSAPEYLTNLPGSFLESLGGQAWVVIALACVGWATSGWRPRAFVVAAVGVVLVSLTVGRVVVYARYFSVLWPGLAILAAVGVAWLGQRRAATTRAATALSSIVLAVAAAVAFHSALGDADARRSSIDALPLRAYAAAIDDGKGVIGARAHQGLVSVDADIRAWGDQFLTEEEYVTFLTWPSDEAVIEIMERHDIGWVFIDRRRQLEGAYNDTWLVPHYGLTARHVERVDASPSFCPWLGGPDDFRLYRLGPCSDG